MPEPSDPYDNPKAEPPQASDGDTATLPPRSSSTDLGSIDGVSIDIENIVDLDSPGDIAQRLQDLDDHDAARVMANLTAERAGRVADLLDAEQCADIVTEMDPGRAADVIEEMNTSDAAEVLAEMDPDDRVDVLDKVDTETKHDELVAGLDEEDQEEVRQLEQFAPDTAGGVMTTQVTSLFEYLTVQDAIDQLRALNEKLEQMFYVYVVDSRRHLVGVLSMRDMILAQPATVLRELMIPDVRAVPGTMDQEEVAHIFKKYDYLAMPVVDDKHRLIGLITVDDIVDVLQEETTEDFHKLFGAGAEEKLDSPWFFSFQKRVGWLLVNLVTAFAAAAVVAVFAGTIDKLPILAVFMPIIAGMGGNASAQAMAVAVRGISIGKVDKRLIQHVLRRELMCGLMTGLAVGLLTAVIAFIYSTSKDGGVTPALGLGLIVFLALVINHTLACVSGAGIPFVMKRLGFDPAQSATIFATTVTDVVGFLALLGLAALIATSFGLI